MNILEIQILKQNRNNGHLVDKFTDEKKKAVIYKTPNRATDFVEIKKVLSITSLNVFIA